MAIGTSRPSRSARTAAQKFRIGDEIKWRKISSAASTPDRNGKIGADPGGLAERQCQRQHGSLLSLYFASVILYSIMAGARKVSR